MYGIPKGTDLSFLVGRTLIQVCIGTHDLVLNFDGSVSITVTSSIAYAGPGGEHRKSEDFAGAAPAVLGLLSRTVVSYRYDDAGTLMLVFEDGTTLALYDDSSNYESYVIRNGDRVVVV